MASRQEAFVKTYRLELFILHACNRVGQYGEAMSLSKSKGESGIAH